MNSRDIITLVIALLGGGGLLGGIYALLKLRPEAGQIIVATAQDAVVVQRGVIEALQTENERLSRRLDELQAIVSTIRDLHRRISDLEMERDVLKGENAMFRARVEELERINGREGNT